jgi:hypothetical protein
MEKLEQVQLELNQKIIHGQQEMNNVFSLLEEEWKRLKKEDEDLKKRKAEWDLMANKLAKAQKGSERIKLDVGGQIFATSLSTLTSQKGSFFEAMFSGRWEPKVEDDGCYFIDRDPTVFKHILNYLRGQLPTLDVLSSQELQLLQEDAQFYQLPELSQYLKTFPVTPLTAIPVSSPIYRFAAGPNYEVSSDGLQIIKLTTKYIKWNATAITYPIPSSGTHHLKLKLVTSQNGFIMIGVCPPSIKQSQVDNSKHCGWYFYCYNGNLYSGPPQKENNKSYYPTSAIRTGREVGVKMDMTNRQISFTVDGVDRGVGYTDIPTNPFLCFCVLLYNPNDSVRIVE